jgi:REP element-mobilizing transposase RayT
MPAPKGWHSRGYLPHFDAPGEIQAVTFRLADSLPQSLITSWKQALANTPDQAAAAKLHAKTAAYEDAGHGSCLLRNPAHARTVQDALLHFDGDRYRLLEWVIMPNHVHVLFKPETRALDHIVKSWKSFTAREINKAIGAEGTLWFRDYHDRFIRDEDHYQNAKAYIRMNPVRVRSFQRLKTQAAASL